MEVNRTGQCSDAQIGQKKKDCDWYSRNEKLQQAVKKVAICMEFGEGACLVPSLDDEIQSPQFHLTRLHASRGSYDKR
jgi:hypothetical protein